MEKEEILNRMAIVHGAWVSAHEALNAEYVASVRMLEQVRDADMAKLWDELKKLKE